ncbi:hypothetical protein F2Q68_00028978 [Brassica cretica]|uniref:Uncharacterized protein n=1 Tax=Brassica cretica TaxID=69181 RepID=A0A8S9GG27_BRACR|nr:hypothetical protein F2Q68_00028978 [Brassica cretica]
MQYCRKGISSIASSPMSTRVKHAWEEQDKLVLGLAFIGGWFVKANINVLKRREDWYRVHRFIDDEKKRLEGKRARIEKGFSRMMINQAWNIFYLYLNRSRLIPPNIIRPTSTSRPFLPWRQIKAFPSDYVSDTNPDMQLELRRISAVYGGALRPPSTRDCLHRQ